MKPNRMDIITDLTKSRIKSIYGEIEKQYGGSNPYRQVPISKKEMQLNYDDMMSREEQLRRDFGDTAVDNYIQANKLGGK